MEGGDEGRRVCVRCASGGAAPRLRMYVGSVGAVAVVIRGIDAVLVARIFVVPPFCWW